MSQSLSKLYVHLIFHVKDISPRIEKEDLKRIHAYIGQLVNASGCMNVWTGGTEDHVHVLFVLSKNENVSNIVEMVKRNSSRWIKTISPHYRMFSWQGGYAAFSVSQSAVQTTVDYIKNQEQHHKRRTFAEEYKKFLELYDVDYNEEYYLRD